MQKLKSWIDKEEEWNFYSEPGAMVGEITQIAKIEERSVYITLDDDDLVYNMWAIEEGEDDFAPQNYDMGDHGCTHSMYYSKKNDDWMVL